MPHVMWGPQQHQAPQMFDGAARRVEKADDAAILRPADTPDEPKGHECQEPVSSPDVDPHPPLGRNKPCHDANDDKAHQEPVEQPRWQIPDFDPTVGCWSSGSLFPRHLRHRVAFRRWYLSTSRGMATCSTDVAVSPARSAETLHEIARSAGQCRAASGLGAATPVPCHSRDARTRRRRGTRRGDTGTDTSLAASPRHPIAASFL